MMVHFVIIIWDIQLAIVNCYYFPPDFIDNLNDIYDNGTVQISIILIILHLTYNFLSQAMSYPI